MAVAAKTIRTRVFKRVKSLYDAGKLKGAPAKWGGKRGAFAFINKLVSKQVSDVEVTNKQLNAFLNKVEKAVRVGKVKPAAGAKKIVKAGKTAAKKTKTTRLVTKAKAHCKKTGARAKKQVKARAKAVKKARKGNKRVSKLRKKVAKKSTPSTRAKKTNSRQTATKMTKTVVRKKRAVKASKLAAKAKKVYHKAAKAGHRPKPKEAQFVMLETSLGRVTKKGRGLAVVKWRSSLIEISGNALIDVSKRLEKAGKAMVKRLWFKRPGSDRIEAMELKGKQITLGPVYIIRKKAS
ncbi:hypothetical protein OAU50_03385 [Planctomycetota bacterium]|nr:hypothetical protein [Planctomycetota bacterium]